MLNTHFEFHRILPMTDQSQFERREVYFSGMVQGVGFRFTTIRVAARHDVTGYVQNLPDGRVLVVAEGTAGELDRFLAGVATALGSYIREREQLVGKPTRKYADFGIRY